MNSKIAARASAYVHNRRADTPESQRTRTRAKAKRQLTETADDDTIDGQAMAQAPGENRLDSLLALADTGRSDIAVKRLIVTGVSRHFHGIDDARRARMITEAPRITGTHWDAVIAATVEHVCRTHGWTAPAWTEDPNRFLTVPWAQRSGRLEQETALADCPAAFIRRNVFIDPRNLDARGGETETWTT